MSESMNMPPLLAFTGFLLFLALGVWVSRTEGESRRRAITTFLLYVIGFSGVVIATQKDAWPFTTYVLASAMPRADRPICRIKFRGVDLRGTEWEIDPYTWSPVPLSIMEHWYKRTFETFSEEKKRRALEFMLAMANDARSRLHRGERIGPDRWIGPVLSIRHWWLFTRYPHVPPDPYVAFHAYRSCAPPPIEGIRRAEAEETLLASTNGGRSSRRE